MSAFWLFFLVYATCKKWENDASSLHLHTQLHRFSFDCALCAMLLFTYVCAFILYHILWHMYILGCCFVAWSHCITAWVTVWSLVAMAINVNICMHKHACVVWDFSRYGCTFISYLNLNKSKYFIQWPQLYELFKVVNWTKTKLKYTFIWLNACYSLVIVLCSGSYVNWVC